MVKGCNGCTCYSVFLLVDLSLQWFCFLLCPCCPCCEMAKAQPSALRRWEFPWACHGCDLCPCFQITAGDGKFVITRCCDDGKLRGSSMAKIVIEL